MAGIGNGVRCGGFNGLNRVIARTYPYLKTNLLIGRELTRKISGCAYEGQATVFS